VFQRKSVGSPHDRPPLKAYPRLTRSPETAQFDTATRGGVASSSNKKPGRLFLHARPKSLILKARTPPPKDGGFLATGASPPPPTTPQRRSYKPFTGPGSTSWKAHCPDGVLWLLPPPSNHFYPGLRHGLSLFGACDDKGACWSGVPAQGFSSPFPPVKARVTGDCPRLSDQGRVARRPLAKGISGQGLAAPGVSTTWPPSRSKVVLDWPLLVTTELSPVVKDFPFPRSSS